MIAVQKKIPKYGKSVRITEENLKFLYRFDTDENAAIEKIRAEDERAKVQPVTLPTTATVPSEQVCRLNNRSFLADINTTVESAVVRAIKPYHGI